MSLPCMVVIGCSQGGLAALRKLAGGLISAAPAAWGVVLHIDAHRSILPALLCRAGPLPARQVEDGDPLVKGRIYIAPPDRHFFVQGGRALLSHGPRENWARPAIDPLFRSAAQCFGPRVIGVVLTGNLDDGSAGLREIKARGGLSVVQDPRDAEAPGMPESALRHVDVDHCVPLADMAALLIRLARDVAGPPAPARERWP